MSNLNYNRVIIAGRMTGDPEVRMTASGTNVVTFNVAVNRPARQGQEQQADFLRCISFERTAQFVSQYFRKGQAILLEGHIQTVNYTDQQGVKRFTTDIVCERAYFVDSRAEASAYQAPSPAPAQTQPPYIPSAYSAPAQTPQEEPPLPELPEDNLPF